MVAIVCEAFRCRPSEALEELEHTPAGLIEDVLELREYAAVKRAYDRAEKKEDLPDSPMLDTMKEILYELLHG